MSAILVDVGNGLIKRQANGVALTQNDGGTKVTNKEALSDTSALPILTVSGVSMYPAQITSTAVIFEKIVLGDSSIAVTQYSVAKSTGNITTTTKTASAS